MEINEEVEITYATIQLTEEGAEIWRFMMQFYPELKEFMDTDKARLIFHKGEDGVQPILEKYYKKREVDW